MDQNIEIMMQYLETSTDESFFFERTVLLDKAYALYKHLPADEMYVKSFAYVIDNMSVTIRNGERLVGTMRQDTVNAQQEAYYIERCEDSNVKLTPLMSFDSLHLWNFTDNDDKYAPVWFCSYGHNVGDYGKVISIGYEGLIREARESLSQVERTEKERRFLCNTIVVCEAMIRLGYRYRDLALRMAAEAPHPEEAERLNEIAAILSISPAKPAHTLREALQTLWFTHMVECCVVGCRDYSFGRVDCYLEKYYCSDIKKHIATREEEKLLFEDLYIHLNELIGYICKDVDAKRVLCANSIQYFVLGGTDASGNDVTNDISYLAIEAMNELPTAKTPDLIVRWHKNIDPDFWKFAVNTCTSGRGYPSFFNEKRIEEGLVNEYGVDRKTANSFAFYGCNNIVLPGVEDELMEAWHNCAKFLELAMNGGKCPITNKQLGPATILPEHMRSIDDLMEAFRVQIAFFLKRAREEIWKNNQIWIAMKPFSFESVIATHCIFRGQTLLEGGSDYKHYNNHFVGIATVADSIATVDRLVFQERRLTMQEFNAILKADWQGALELKSYICNKLPKYGNGDNEIDVFATRAANLFINEVKKLRDLPNGRRAHASIYSLNHHRPMGKDVGATPNGRNAYSHLSENISGTYGCELNGPTGILRSASRLPLSRTVSGAHNIKFQKLVMAGKEGAARLSALIKAYFDMGGTQLQINVVDPSVLLDAQVHPSEHRDLMVRVFGFTDYFISLNKDQQQEIVDRDTLGQ